MVTFGLMLGLFKRAKRIAEAVKEKEDVTKRAQSIPHNALANTFGDVTPFLFNLGGKEAYSNKIFYTAQNILVKKLVEAPIMFAKRKGKDNRKMEKFYAQATTNEKRALIKAQNVQEVENHALNDLFDNPNDYQSGIELMEDFWYNYGFGDGFLYFETLGELSRDKRPVAVHSLSRGRCQPVKSGDRFNPISFYRYTTINGENIEIPASQVLHLKHWNPEYGALKGMGVDIAAAMDICLNNANNETQGSAFRNGGRGTLFSSDLAVAADDGAVTHKLSSKQVESLKETIVNDFSGIKNYKKLHFTNGLVNVQAFGDTNAEMELVQSEGTQWKNIFAVCGVPWALSPIASESAENTVVTAYKSLVTNTVLPEIKKFDQKLTQKVKQWWPDMIAVTDVTEYSELTPDLKLMKDTYGSPLINVDEHRAVFGFEAVGGKVGATILVPSGFMPMDEILAGPQDNNPNDPFDENTL